jgi:hypothetical protein
MPSPLEQIVEQIDGLFHLLRPSEGQLRREAFHDKVERHWPLLRAALSPDAGARPSIRCARCGDAGTRQPHDAEFVRSAELDESMWTASPCPTGRSVRDATDEYYWSCCCNPIPCECRAAHTPEGPDPIRLHWYDGTMCSNCGERFEEPEQKNHEWTCWFGLSAERVAQSKAEIARGEFTDIAGLAAPAPSSPAAQYERKTTDEIRAAVEKMIRAAYEALVALGEDARARRLNAELLCLSDLTRCESALSASQARVGELEKERDAVVLERDQESEAATGALVQLAHVESAREAALAEIARMKEIDDEQREMMAEAALAQGRRADALEKERDAAVREREDADAALREVKELLRAEVGMSPDGQGERLSSVLRRVLSERDAALSRAQAAEERERKADEILSVLERRRIGDLEGPLPEWATADEPAGVPMIDRAADRAHQWLRERTAALRAPVAGEDKT